MPVRFVTFAQVPLRSAGKVALRFVSQVPLRSVRYPPPFRVWVSGMEVDMHTLERHMREELIVSLSEGREKVLRKRFASAPSRGG